MSGNYQADILFVIDASRSMEPCIEGVKQNISSFADVFRNDPNHQWNLRFDFIAHDDTTLENRAVGVDKDFRQRVVSAGGAYDDVDVRFSLIWNNLNDLDLHVITPSGEEIYFGEKTSRCGGKLDVDRNVSGETRQPVENVRWKTGKAPKGEYRVLVNYFGTHESSQQPTHFKVEAYVGGQLQHFEDVFSQDSEDTDIEIGTFSYPSDLNAGLQSRRQEEPGGFRAQSIFELDLVTSLYGTRQGKFFTSDIREFQRALEKVKIGENEAPLVALDCALDFPWRDSSVCRRIIILMTDEPVEGGNYLTESTAMADKLIEKIHALKALLYMVTPESAIFEKLSAADKSEWEVVQGGDGLASVNFSKLLDSIAKSISKSQSSQASGTNAFRALFGQDRW